MTDDYPTEWGLEVLRKGAWTLRIHGSLDDVLDEYYFHRDDRSFDKWRITAPQRREEL